MPFLRMWNWARVATLALLVSLGLPSELALAQMPNDIKILVDAIRSGGHRFDPKARAHCLLLIAAYGVCPVPPGRWGPPVTAGDGPCSFYIVSHRVSDDYIRSWDGRVNLAEHKSGEIFVNAEALLSADNVDLSEPSSSSIFNLGRTFYMTWNAPSVIRARGRNFNDEEISSGPEEVTIKTNLPVIVRANSSVSFSILEWDRAAVVGALKSVIARCGTVASPRPP